MRPLILLALLALAPTARAADAPAKWERLTAEKWREIINEKYGPPRRWSSDELFPHYVARALAGTPAGYERRYKPRLYNGTRPELIGRLGAINVLVDVRPTGSPLNLTARQNLKAMIDWLNEEATNRKGGGASHGVLVVITPQPAVLPKAGKTGTEVPLFGPLGKGESSVIDFSKSPGRRVFVFHAVAEYQKRDGAYYFRVGPAKNLTGELTDIKGEKIKTPEPLPADKGTPEGGELVKRKE